MSFDAAPAPPLRPLAWPGALLYFGGSALLFRGCVYQLLPWLLQAGAPLFWAFITSYSVALGGLLLAAGVALRRDGYPLTWATFRQRLRFRRLTRAAWGWSAGLFLLGFLLTGLLLPSARFVARIPAFHPPAFLPAMLNPLAPPTLTLTHFLGQPLAGQWWVGVVYALFLLFFNLLGEEVWFRGYLLPRQQLVHGAHTWLVHGALWTLFHLPIYPWYVLYLLPTALTVSYAAQKTGSSWASYLVHGLGNGLLVLIPLTRGILAS